MSSFFIKCEFCEYKTDVKCNMKRRQNVKHKDEICEICEKYKNVQMCENVTPKCENFTLCKFHYIKCNKEYKSKRYLQNHQNKSRVFNLS